MDGATDDLPTDEEIDWVAGPPSLLTFSDYGEAEGELRPWYWHPVADDDGASPPFVDARAA